MRSGWTTSPSTSQPGPVEHVVEGQERVGQDDAFRARVRDVALVPESDVLEPDRGGRAYDAREPADTLGDHRVAFVGHGGRSLLALPKRLLDLPELRAREMADLGRKAVERGRAQGERRQ